MFALVLDAWGLLGSAFAPLVIVHALGRRVLQALAIAMIVLGVATFLTVQQLGWGRTVYGVGPGVVARLFGYVVERRLVKA